MPTKPKAEDRKSTFGEREQDRYRALVGELLRELSQADVARLLGIRPDHLNRVLSGQRRVGPALRMAAANALKIDVRYFSEPTEKPWQEWSRTPPPYDPRAKLWRALSPLAARVFAAAAQDLDPSAAGFELARAVLTLPAFRLATMIVDAHAEADSRDEALDPAAMIWSLRLAESVIAMRSELAAEAADAARPPKKHP